MSEEYYVLQITIKDKPVTIDLNEVLALDNFYVDGLVEEEIKRMIMKIGHMRMQVKMAEEETIAWRRRVEQDIESYVARYGPLVEEMILKRKGQQVADKKRTLSSVDAPRKEIEGILLTGDLANSDLCPDGFDPEEYSMLLETKTKLLHKEGILNGAWDTLKSRSMELMSVSKSNREDAA